ncbi:MAG TPA: MgtC/SapB family protein [Segeticoccus sp.]|uniref:MgtC/SapB family protein n=1 Tax=Segeticoccus sp. TaxID=2706531 RepID=UPI002D7FA7C4|nr:MgtC/SapB family protein [Segeticoccus sp.]HET8601091.1 MgtC/SapB family protein [Segeticoccus sp.]
MALALVLSAAIGLERELRGKSAGLRTHALIGFASALFVLVSKYGFTDVLGPQVRLDPSRVAAGIVSGIGFIGGGLIFVRRDAVRGLTTAASVWLTTAVGMAAGAGLPVLAAVTTAGFFGVVFGLRPLARHLPGAAHRQRELTITYEEGRGLLRRILEICTEQGWIVAELSTRRPTDSEHADSLVSVQIRLDGGHEPERLVEQLGAVEGVVVVRSADPEDE